MKAFWKLSDQLNGMSVDGFRDLIQDIVTRLQTQLELSKDVSNFVRMLPQISVSVGRLSMYERLAIA